MGLDKPNVVDAIGIETASGFVVLTIADSWDWLDERAHLLALQAKLNAYLRFIESGEISQSYPKAQDRQLVIDVIGRFPLPQIGIDFLTRASDACAELAVKIRHTHYAGPEQQEEKCN